MLAVATLAAVLAVSMLLVASNAAGLAARLSVLPGVSPRGGVRSGLVAGGYLFVGLAAVAAAASGFVAVPLGTPIDAPDTTVGTPAVTPAGSSAPTATAAGSPGSTTGSAGTPASAATSTGTRAAPLRIDGTVYRVTVVDVVDGDTIDVRYRNGSTDTVRLLGVDTPEVHTGTNPREFEGVPDSEAGRACLRRVGEAAGRDATARLAGETVAIVVDDRADRRGGYGRLLAYVVVDGEHYNHRLVAEGYARVYDAPFALRERFYGAEADAMAAGRRVWACRDPDGATPRP